MLRTHQVPATHRAGRGKMAIKPVNLQNNHVVEKLCSVELAALRSEVQAGRGDNHLKSLDERGRAQELVRDQYSGRYAFELLQNADDAMAKSGHKGKVCFVLSSQALLVANTGQPFGKAEVEAICGLGRSSKDPSTSIGYKGLGFKSVAEISDEPQIISGKHRFFFSATRLRAEVQKIAGAQSATQRLPTYAFPWALTDAGLGNDGSLVRRILADGYTTIIRLPLKRGISRDDVAAAVRASLSPRQLLFLRNVGSVAFEDTVTPVACWSVSARARRTDDRIVELTTNTGPERWMVFARSAKVDQRLTRPLGSAWAKVKDVSFAVALRLGERGPTPVAAQDARIHAYFQTDEATGLPFVVHADFALELDRRRVARTREATTYNDWLCDQVAHLAGAVVAPALAAESGASPRVVCAMLALEPARGVTGAQLRAACLAQLSVSAWLPRRDLRLRKPNEISLLPRHVAGLPAIYEYLDGRAVRLLLPPTIEESDDAAHLLSTLVGVRIWDMGHVVEHLRKPTKDNYRKFWQFLLAWRATSPGLDKILGDRPWLLRVDNQWAAPAQGLYLPRQKDVALPAGIPIPVVQLPNKSDVNLRAMLMALGVKEFSWRELASGTLIPLLKDAKQTRAMRERALAGLAAYFQDQRAGDERVDTAVGQILLRASTANGDRVVLRRASATYVCPQFVGNDRLLRIYGPFGEAEFLAEDVAMLQAAAGNDLLKFLTWLGVAVRPRVDAVTVRVGQARKSARQHEHRRYGGLWLKWLNQAETSTISNACFEHGEPILTKSFALDRLEQLVDSKDAERLRCLWDELAASWTNVYEATLSAELCCDHYWHRGPRERLVPSLLAFGLRDLPWVPCLCGGRMELRRPAQAWRNATGQPAHVLRKASLLPAELDTAQSWAMSHRLGVVDSTHLSVPDLVAFLKRLQAACPEPVDDMPPDVRDSARWAMRQLNRTTVVGPWPEQGSIPLLARRGCMQLFETAPAVAVDPVLARLFGDDVAILDADKDQSSLAERLGLEDLGKAVKARPNAQPADATMAEAVQRRILGSLGPILALFRGTIPSNYKEATGRLQRLAVMPCNSLEITYTYKSLSKSTTSDALIVFRVEQVRSIRRRVGTAYVSTDVNATINFYELGRQLAIYLDAPTLADGFAILLRDPSDSRYLASQHVPDAAVAEAWAALGQQPADEPDPLGEAASDLWLSADAPTNTPAPAEPPTNQPLVYAPTSDKEKNVAPDLAPARRSLPEVDHTKVAARDAMPAPVQTHHGRATTQRLAIEPLTAGWTDFVALQGWTTELGKRAEEIVFQNERLRLIGAGKNPDIVQLISQINNSADHDIQSVDDDDQKRYIEVKGTRGSDAHAAFDISAAELRVARRERHRYWIYRVIRVDTATPEIVRFQDPIQMWLDGKASLSISGANMSFGAALPDSEAATT